MTISETLTTQQLNCLKALIACEKAISSTEVMHRYQIASTTSISRSKAALIKNDILDNKAAESSTTSLSRSKVALIKNDILDNKAAEFSFQDPIHAYWLKTEYFAKQS